MGGQKVSTWKGRGGAPPVRPPGTASAHRRIPGTIQLPPPSFPKGRSAAACHQERPGGRWWAATYGPQVEDTARRHADERRLPRAASPQESDNDGWPAANNPQIPSVPGARDDARTSATDGGQTARRQAPARGWETPCLKRTYSW